MGRRILGVIAATDDGSPLGGLGAPARVALTPFAGRFRLIDFAIATLRNSGVDDVRVCAPEPAPELEAHLRRLGRPDAPGPQLVPVRPSLRWTGPVVPLLDVLRAVDPVVQDASPDVVVLLSADHILLADLRALLGAHDATGADVTLAAVSVFPGQVGARPLLAVDAAGRVRDLEWRVLPDAAGDTALAWTGDLAIRPEALRTLAGLQPGDAAAAADALARHADMAAHDVLEHRLPGGQSAAYWHDPTSIEAYYTAQMELCTAQPALDLYNPAWPLPAAATGLAPAKVVADTAGRAGQALDALVSEGSVIRGGVVIKSVLGHRVLVDSGAEVEDCVLLDGCRIGRGARVRRALVGAGAEVPEGAEIGYGGAGDAGVSVRRSGLTLVHPRSSQVAVVG